MKEPREFHRVGIVGMGYVGLTLAAAMARKGYEVHGVDTSPAVREALAAGRAHIYEPGVDETFAELLGKNIFVHESLPSDVDAAIISVSTPVDPVTHQPYLGNITAAARHVAERCKPDTLVVVRSTVPVGTSRSVVLPVLEAEWKTAHLVMAPERTIQGQALRELVELPQVVGGLDAESLKLGLALFDRLSHQLVPVSNVESAELVKLTNNCHTDVIYSFGNELAMLTERLGLDPLEIRRACNLDYPRPDIALPGYVGGGCLSKDPYIMISSTARRPGLIASARALNEEMPVHVARRVTKLMPEGGTLAVLGWAYKGKPPTDDMRGSPIVDMMPVFSAAGLHVLGHDPLVAADVILGYGGHPVDIETAFGVADAVLLITDHPEYAALDVSRLLADSPVRLVFDSWRILDEVEIAARGVRYAGLGYVPAEVTR